ncbi:hypothetical protein [Paenibacillus sp.]|uniref:hypothetical protein n=1 Tax=Paenibacillus sp. TaxID=58172 RepID=UPI002D441EAF|nr:hypothetical protein [Paenibacillus sp.]HZG87290.1 hypothetical protein [Paenibacillus sp.]
MNWLDRFKKDNNSARPAAHQSLCTQCGTPAMYQIQGHLLCLNCYHKYQQVNDIHLNHLYKQMNFLTDSIEMTTGIRGLTPKYDVRPPTYFTGNINDIKIKDSVVGSVNTGNLEKLNVSLRNVSASGSEQLASLLKHFVESVLSSELKLETKNEIVELVDTIANEVSTPKETRKPSVIKSLINSVKELTTASNGLFTLWDNVIKMISSIL